jgi:hypothetical protein
MPQCRNLEGAGSGFSYRRRQPETPAERSLGMATTYKQKLIGEIISSRGTDTSLYRIMRTLRSELTNQTAVTPKKNARGSEI